MLLYYYLDWPPVLNDQRVAPLARLVVCIESYSAVSILLSDSIVALIGQKTRFYIALPSCEHLHVSMMNT